MRAMKIFLVVFGGFVEYRGSIVREKNKLKETLC